MLEYLRDTVALGGAFAGATTAAGQEEALAVPSDNPVWLQEWFIDPLADGQLDYARFRFVMPALAQGTRFEQIEANFAHLCENVAMPLLAQAGLSAPRVVVSVAERETEFGTASPGLRQFFEAFRVENNLCIWEGF